LDQVIKGLVIARYTFQELVRSKVLWNVVVIALGLAGLTLAAAEFTFGVPARVAFDLGLAFLALSGYGLSFFAGVPLIKQEEESRTIYLIISRPVKRSIFLIGKLLGVSVFLALNFSLITVSIVGVVTLTGGEMNFISWMAVLLTFLEVLLLLTLVVTLSLVANRAITLICGLVILIAGHAVAETGGLLFVKNRPWLEVLVKMYDWVLPGFHRFNLKDIVLYKTELPDSYLFQTLSYGGLYGLALLFSACWLIERKDFD
jgi:ABC-type transport system involved in multi-copper enzyme maturation permease subunit